tara:strand:+ start:3102 stop:3293 length:192 start_codon:yes stop_codon:yes gene_type:complete
MPEHKERNQDAVEHMEDKVRRMVADTLYGEAVRDIRELQLYVYENYNDGILEKMLNDLIEKMR